MRKSVLPLFALILLVAGCSGTSDRIQEYNQPASVMTSDALPFNPLEETVVTSFVNTRAKTMSTLYGNTTAITHVRANSTANYPAGSILSLVTWKQQTDARWFGGNIPSKIESVEVVRFESADKINYQYYAGRPLQQANHPEDSEARIKAIISARASVMP